jgi:hypothetical protein
MGITGSISLLVRPKLKDLIGGFGRFLGSLSPIISLSD